MKPMGMTHLTRVRPVVEPVIIGNATLYLGDCREILPTLGKVDAVITDPLSSFRLHVTRLAEANKVAKVVGLVGSIKHAIGLDVVNGDPVSNMFPTVLANTSVSFNSRGPCYQPSLAAVRCWPPHPVMSAFSRFMVMLVLTMARLAAKPFASDALVLAHYPQRRTKFFAAASASKFFARLDDDSSRRAWFSLIGRRNSCPQFVSDQRRAAHNAVFHVPLTATSPAAKPGAVGAIWLHMKRLAAYLACLCNHIEIIPKNMGSGSTGIAKQSHLFEAAA